MLFLIFVLNIKAGVWVTNDNGGVDYISALSEVNCELRGADKTGVRLYINGEKIYTLNRKNGREGLIDNYFKLIREFKVPYNKCDELLGTRPGYKKPEKK